MGRVSSEVESPISAVECVRDGWRLTKDQFPLLLAITLAGSFLGNILPVPVLLGPMMCGIHLAYLEKVDGRRVTFDVLFRGFDHFGPSLVATLVIMISLAMVSVLFGVVAIGLTLPMVWATEGGFFSVAPQLLVVYLCLYVLWCLVCINVYFFLMLSYVLIPDQGLGGVESLRISARTVWRHVGAFIGLAMLASAIPAALCVAVYGAIGLVRGFDLVTLLITTGICSVLSLFSLPPLLGAITVAYRRIFPAPAAESRLTEYSTYGSAAPRRD